MFLIRPEQLAALEKALGRDPIQRCPSNQLPRYAQASGGKCDEIAKLVFALEATLKELQGRLDKLKRSRDELKHLKNMCPAWKRREQQLLEEDKEIEEQPQNLIWQVVDAKSRLADCLFKARIFEDVDCSDYAAEVDRLEQQQTALEQVWQKHYETEEELRSNLRRCPSNLADVDEDLREVEDRIAQLEQELNDCRLKAGRLGLRLKVA